MEQPTTFDEVLFPKDAEPVDPNRPMAHAQRESKTLTGVLIGAAVVCAVIAYITLLIVL